MPDAEDKTGAEPLISRAKKDAAYLVMILAALSGSGYGVFFDSDGDGGKRANLSYELLKQAHDSLKAEHEELEDEVLYLRSRLNELGMLFLGRPMAPRSPADGRTPVRVEDEGTVMVESAEGPSDSECSVDEDCPSWAVCDRGECAVEKPKESPKSVKLPDTLEQAMQEAQ